MSIQPDPARLLQARGLRATPQRRVVLEVLARARRPLRVEGIYQQARAQSPRISLATVYRTVATLREAGVVEQRYESPTHEQATYELAGRPPHFTFTCVVCGSRTTIESVHLIALRQEMAARYHMQVIELCGCLTGYCPTCSEQRPQPSFQKEVQ